MSHPTLAFIGAGNMATAIIKGLIKNGQPQHLVRVCDPSAEQLAKLQADYPQLITTQINAEGVTGADLVVLAVKPQVMAEVCEPLLQAVPELAEKLIVSVAAGISVARLQGLLNAKRIVRTMPNTPCLIGQGMTGLFADANVSPADKHQAEQLMLAVGKTAWVNSEAAMNQVIAASGSAPAYFFLFLRAMQRSLENMGMDAETARQLVQQPWRPGLHSGGVVQSAVGSLPQVRSLVQASLASTPIVPGVSGFEGRRQWLGELNQRPSLRRGTSGTNSRSIPCKPGWRSSGDSGNAGAE